MRKAVVLIAPLIVWLAGSGCAQASGALPAGDDFFHQGAFREMYSIDVAWILESPVPRPGGGPAAEHDLYDWYLAFPTVAAFTDSTGFLRVPTGRRFIEHPAYDSVWQQRAFQQQMTRASVPTLTVGGWWDSEDLFGAQETARTLDRLDTTGVHTLVIGPWSHRQWIMPDGSALAPASAYQAQTRSIYRSAAAPSHVDVMVLPR